MLQCDSANEQFLILVSFSWFCKLGRIFTKTQLSFCFFCEAHVGRRLWLEWPIVLIVLNIEFDFRLWQDDFLIV